MNDKALAEQIGAFVKHHRMEQNKTQGVFVTTELRNAIDKTLLNLKKKEE